MSSNFARSTSVSWSYANEAAIMCPGALHARERVLSGSRKMEQARRIFLMVVRGRMTNLRRSSPTAAAQRDPAKLRRAAEFVKQEHGPHLTTGP
jgi:hypothetical protein